MNGDQVLEHQLHIRLLAPEFAKRVHNQPMPGDRCRNSNSKGTGFAEGYSLGAALRLIDVLQDTSRIVQEQFPRRIESDASGQSVEQEEPQLPLQISDLPGQGRLRDMETIGRLSEMLPLSNGDEIAEMPEFH